MSIHEDFRGRTFRETHHKMSPKLDATLKSKCKNFILGLSLKISEINLEYQENKHDIFGGFPISPHVWTYVYSVFFRNPSHILSSYCSPTGDSKTAFGWVAQQTAVNLHLPSVTFSKPWVGVWWRVLKVVKIWLQRKWEGKIFFPSFFSNSDFLL